MDRPHAYTKCNGLQKRDNEFTLNNFVRLVRWKKFARILDLGCGDGTTTLEVLEPRIPQDYVKLVGSDLQEKMIRFARESNTKSRVHFIQFDIAADKLLVGPYDHIFSFFAFHWVLNLRKAFKNVYDLLTPGGDMLINLVAESPFFEILKRQLENPIWSTYFSNGMKPPIRICKISEDDLRTHLIENGFINIKIYAEERNFVYNNWAQCLKFFLALDPIMSKLDQEQQQEYLVDFFFTLKDIFKDFEEANGKIRKNYKLFVVYASKPE